MPSSLRPVDAEAVWPLFDVAATRRIETLALEQAPAHSLMQRAGLASARLALALAPHAQTIWVAAGPGNNGGDGLEAAAQLQARGKQVTVSWLGDPGSASSDTNTSWRRAVDSGARFVAAPPEHVDLCLDALLGIGATRPPEGRMAQWVAHMNSAGAPVLAIDVPTGLNADTGHCAGPHVRAHTTLSLLTLKPGLFTAQGRDAAGSVWLDDLQTEPTGAPIQAIASPCGTYGGCPVPRLRPHTSHKGSFGDVAVVGGSPGMVGAALLAASAALHFGAGRVYLAALDPAFTGAATDQPELMLRQVGQLALANMTVVCGCGGGDAIRAPLPQVLATAAALVLDADGLNAVAQDVQLQHLLRARASRGLRTVLTPHPLEAARMLGTDSPTVQRDRLACARQLAETWQCTVVLKGSGTVVATPQLLVRINPTGNARLAAAGTGDVLAGALGAALANGLPAHEAAWQAVYRHGQCADSWPDDTSLTASRLAGRMRAWVT